MPLDRLSQITEVGIKSGITLRNINVEGAYVSGVITATSLAITGAGISIAGVVTATSFDGNVTGRINPTSLNVSGVSTFQGNVFHGDGDIAYFGDGNDLLIFHNSTDSIIRDDGTGDLFLQGGNRIRLTNPTGIETYAVFNQDGASELYFDNAKKLETTGAGVSITGISSASGGFVGNLTGNVNATGLSTFSGGIQVGATTSITVGNTFIRSTSVGIGSTDTTGRNSGVGTAPGTLIYNTTTNAVEAYGGLSGWITVKTLDAIQATGGTESTTARTGYKVHTYTSTNPFVVSSGSQNVEILVVAGGGSGGIAGSGGGAGGVSYISSYRMNPGTYTITVGGGGAAAPPGWAPDGTTPGQNSSFYAVGITSITSRGGGPGAHGGNGFPGGSGGGGGYGGSGGTATQSAPVNPGLPTLINSGNTGGSGNPSGPQYAGGGGGGAGGVGNNAPPTAGGPGGPGITYSINGTSTTYGGGGGGGCRSPGTGGTGGPGGGGDGRSTDTPGGTGGTNTGGGGGGSGAPNGGAGGSPGGAGGSGIVIIAYPTT